MSLEGKVALITGGGSGIGAAISERFVADGAKVCISGRRREVLEELADGLPSGAVVTCPGDTSKDEDVSRMIATTLDFGGRLDVLVNNAAIGAVGGVADADRGEWRRVLDVNLTGPFMLMQEAIPHMIRNGGGSIINIASVGGMRCVPKRAAYATSKAGLIMLTQQAALDYGAYGIRCNAVCPGVVRTPLMEEGRRGVGEALGQDMHSYLSMLSEALPLRRYAVPREIAGVCAFLASEDSSFMTGVALLVDGGTAIVDVFGAAGSAAERRAVEA